MKSLMVKRDFLDKAVSDAVRASWGMCAKCYKPFERQSNGSWSQNFHCSHYFGRGSGNSTRYHPENLVGLCGGCHYELGNDPGAHYKFIKTILGEVCYDALELRKHQVMKYSKLEKKEMAAFYRKETERIMERRKDGEVGYIPLVSWD